MSATVLKLPRQWNGAKSTVTLENWESIMRAPDVDIRHGLVSLRSRSRTASQNIDHVRGFLGMVETNVIGRQGIVLQSKARQRNGKPDKRTQGVVEGAWLAWGKRGSADVTGQFSWKALKRQAARTVARDGEALYRMIENWDNPHGFALQQIDPACLDVGLNRTGESGVNEIRMGVELDGWRRPVAYYLTDEPNILSGSYSVLAEHTRVPAKEIIHLFLPEWVWQSRGVPWLSTGLMRLHMLSGYEDAAITAARVGAAKMGFYKRNPDAPDLPEEQSADGSLVQDVAPGSFEQLPEGWDFVGWDPAYPNTDHGEFVKSCLRAIATGLGVSYNLLANDLEGVNYSSLRQGAIQERDLWMNLQEWFIESFCDPIFSRWLDVQSHLGTLAIPDARYPEAARVVWQPRRWQWVDPVKDIQANKEAIALRVRSVSDVIRETGRDPADVWDELASDMKQLEALGLSMQSTEPRQGSDSETDAELDGQLDVKQSADAYGVGVRAGMVTPQEADEEHFRSTAGLPSMSESVKEAWADDGGIRRPITLQSGDAYEAAQDEIAGETQETKPDDED